MVNSKGLLTASRGVHSVDTFGAIVMQSSLWGKPLSSNRLMTELDKDHGFLVLLHLPEAHRELY